MRRGTAQGLNMPGDPMDREYLRDMGDMLKSRLPDNHGFLLLTFEFGSGDGQRLHYISNAQRADAINVLKEFLLKAGAAEDWMKHIS